MKTNVINNMRKTHEQLNQEITVLEQENKALKDDRDFYKKEFAKAFGWVKRERFSEDQDYIIPTWAQIFLKIGELNYISQEKRLIDMNFDTERRLKVVEELVLPEQDMSM